MPSTPDRDLQRLAALARRRRADLGLALNDAVAKAGGVSKNTWRRVEQGLPIRETNYVKIDGLLKWAPGSCLAALEGRDPIPVTEVTDSPSGSMKSPIPDDVLDDRARRIVQLALLATAKASTAEEIREQSERVVRDLREHGII